MRSCFIFLVAAERCLECHCLTYSTHARLYFPTGYNKYYNALRDFLYSQPFIVDKVELIPLEDRGTTGNFEVTVVDSGEYLHSKKKYGQGRAESDAEKMAILDQINELLN